MSLSVAVGKETAVAAVDIPPRFFYTRLFV